MISKKINYKPFTGMEMFSSNVHVLVSCMEEIIMLEVCDDDLFFFSQKYIHTFTVTQINEME